MGNRDPRHVDLAKIHLGAKQLGMDTTDKDPHSSYRVMLWTAARVRSASELDATGRARVIAHLRACGVQFTAKQRLTVGDHKKPLLGKVYALLGDRPLSYAEGILRRMYGEAAPARLEWASNEQLGKLVAALNYDRRRHFK